MPLFAKLNDKNIQTDMQYSPFSYALPYGQNCVVIYVIYLVVFFLIGYCGSIAIDDR